MSKDWEYYIPHYNEDNLERLKTCVEEKVNDSLFKESLESSFNVMEYLKEVIDEVTFNRILSLIVVKDLLFYYPSCYLTKNNEEDRVFYFYDSGFCFSINESDELDPRGTFIQINLVLNRNPDNIKNKLKRFIIALNKLYE